MNLNRYFSLSRASTLRLLGPVVLSATACPASTAQGRKREQAHGSKVASAVSARAKFTR